MVRSDAPEADWDRAPVPILVVEILSPSTRRRDREQKREFYIDAGVAEYWMVDPERRTITAVASGRRDVVMTESLTWSPHGAGSPLTVEVSRLFVDR